MLFLWPSLQHSLSLYIISYCSCSIVDSGSTFSHFTSIFVTHCSYCSGLKPAMATFCCTLPSPPYWVYVMYGFSPFVIQWDICLVLKTSSACTWAAWLELSLTGGKPKSVLSLFILSSTCCTSSSRGIVLGCWLDGCRIVIAGLSFCWSTKLARAGASKIVPARTIMTIAMPNATLRVAAAAPFFFGGDTGTEIKLFRTPHTGQADSNEPYLCPHTMQSIYESVVC